jgi:hypothetical protein
MKDNISKVSMIISLIESNKMNVNEIKTDVLNKKEKKELAKYLRSMKQDIVHEIIFIEKTQAEQKKKDAQYKKLKKKMMAENNMTDEEIEEEVREAIEEGILEDDETEEKQ